MANIITSKTRAKSYKDFYGRHDKGSPYPAFCKPQLIEEAEAEVHRLKRQLDEGIVKPEAMAMHKAELRKKSERLSEIKADRTNARKAFEENKDEFMKRREAIAEIISSARPSVRQVEKRRVDSRRQLAIELGTNPNICPKDPDTGKPVGLKELAKEYQVLSHLADEESNVGFLQKD